MGILRERMIEEMKLRNFSAATQESYVYAVSRLARYHNKSPDKLSKDAGVFDAYPNLKIILGHLGECLQFAMHRMNDHTFLDAKRQLVRASVRMRAASAWGRQHPFCRRLAIRA
jgi:hypothetical protein